MNIDVRAPLLLRCCAGVALAVALYAFVTWGDFYQLTLLSGPIHLRPDTARTDGAGYIPSPALYAHILKARFLLLCAFCCCIPDLPGNLRRHFSALLGRVIAGHLLFSYLAADFFWFLNEEEFGAPARMAFLAATACCLAFGYDTGTRRFRLPKIFTEPLFFKSFPLLFLFCLAAAYAAAPSLLLREEDFPALCLRGGALIAACAAYALLPRKNMRTP